MKLKKSKLIVFEGVAGAGKTTIIEKLLEKYEDAKLVDPPRWIFKEQGHTLTFKPEENTAQSLTTEENIKRANFFLDGMLEAQKEIIDDGTVYIADRWFYSTLVYQIFDVFLSCVENDDLSDCFKEFAATFLFGAKGYEIRKMLMPNVFIESHNGFLIERDGKKERVELVDELVCKCAQLLDATAIIFMSTSHEEAVVRKQLDFDKERYNEFGLRYKHMFDLFTHNPSGYTLDRVDKCRDVFSAKPWGLDTTMDTIAMTLKFIHEVVQQC